MKPMRKCQSVAFATSAILLLSATLTQTRATTIHFDELGAPQTANGLTFNGASFQFTLGGSASDAAMFGNDAPPWLNYVHGSVLEGDASGVLTVDFVSPQNALSFGIALSIFENLSPAASISLFNQSAAKIFAGDINTETLVDYSEGAFSYGGPDFFSRMVLSFNAPGYGFWLDDLEFTSTPSVAIPDAGPGFSLTALALAGMIASGAALRPNRFVTPA